MVQNCLRVVGPQVVLSEFIIKLRTNWEADQKYQECKIFTYLLINHLEHTFRDFQQIYTKWQDFRDKLSQNI